MLKRKKTIFGRSLSGWFYNLKDEKDAAIVNYMLGYLEAKNIKHKIMKSKSHEDYVDIRVECDDITFEILRHVENGFTMAQA